MGVILIPREVTIQEAKEIWITTQDPDRKEAMKGYENKEVHHEMAQRELEYHNENPELHNSELK